MIVLFCMLRRALALIEVVCTLEMYNSTMLVNIAA